jgi:hypothetical protein
MENLDELVEFKDCLRQLIEDNGGMSPDNLQRIVGEVRKMKPEFSLAHLQNLLRGYPPNNDDRLAVTHTLEPEADRWMSEYWPLEDRKPRELAKLAFREHRSHEAAKEFVDYVLGIASFRDVELTEKEMRTLLNEFHSKREPEVEMEVFELSKV